MYKVLWVALRMGGGLLIGFVLFYGLYLLGGKREVFDPGQFPDIPFIMLMAPIVWGGVLGAIVRLLRKNMEAVLEPMLVFGTALTIDAWLAGTLLIAGLFCASFGLGYSLESIQKIVARRPRAT